MSLKNWSTTAASNASVDSINWAEGQNPSTVNNSAREEMAQVAEWFAMVAGGVISGTVGGTVDAITLTCVPNPPITALAVNQKYLVKAAGANTSTTPTINVGALGAKTIKLPGGTALIASQWGTNDMLLLCYDGTDMLLLSGDRNRAANPSVLNQTLTRNAQIGTTYTVVTGDRSKYITFSNASAVAVTLPQANGSTFGGGWYFWAENIGVGLVTITPTTSNINGAGGTAITLRTNEWALIESDDTNYRALHTGQILGLPLTREIGTRGVFQNVQDAAYPIVMSDAGGHIYKNSASARTWTIPANASVAFPIGTAITFINGSGAGAITIAITTDTLRRGDGIDGTGSRTIASNSVATIIKVTSTLWYITGSFT